MSKLAWYETEIARDMMSRMGGRAIRGVLSNYFSAKGIHTGKLGLIQVANFLEAALNPEDRRALIIVDDYTQRFVKKVTDHLELINMDYKVWSGVLPEVPMSIIEEGAKICEEFKPKVIFGIGGGSVMDTVKTVLIKYEKPEQDLLMILPYFNSLGLRKKVKYWIAIPTTSGTGSEVAVAALITDNRRDPPKKIIVVNDELLADKVILDNDFVKDMPPFLTMATGLDALAHAIGAFVSSWSSPYVDALNEMAIKEIIQYLPRTYKYGANDLEAHSHMQMAALMAALGAQGNMTPGIDHALGHSFGKIFDVHHGLSVGTFLPYSVGFQRNVTDRWKKLCSLFGIEDKNKSRDELFKELIQALKNFITSIDGPTCIKEIKNPIIKKEKYFENLDLLADYAYNDAVTLTSSRQLTIDLYKKIFTYAWDGKNIDF